ncbi:hypothetical protein HMI54_007869 [Coelomomyces lativittatus]|nr:hypothetical protein HMI54_007869 [Coelomomyces lativittatus]
MLSRYLSKLVTSEFTSAFVNYLDWVAMIHTQNKNKSSSINVEYIHINALLGYVQGILIGAICDFPVSDASKKAMLMAFNKLIWIQNDFFTQYYTYDGTDIPESRIVKKGVKLPRPSNDCCVRDN